MSSKHEVKERDKSAFKFGASTRVNCCGGQSLPHNRFANVGRDEERDSAAQTVALLQEFIKQND